MLTSFVGVVWVLHKGLSFLSIQLFNFYRFCNILKALNSTDTSNWSVFTRLLHAVTMQQ